MRSRTIEELIPEGWELVKFTSHTPIKKRVRGTQVIEMEYWPILTVADKSKIRAIRMDEDGNATEITYREYSYELDENEVRAVMNYLTITQGAKP
jgi:hypothetical protein